MRDQQDSKTILVLSTAALLILWGVARMVYLSIPDISEVPGTLPITISNDRIDFGEVPLYGSVIREFVIRFDGEGALHATLSVTGSAFQVSPDELVLQAGIETRVSIQATAAEPGVFDDELRIQFDATGLAPLVIALAGEAAPATEPGSEMLRA